ncbi:tryptophan--tRNA ligase, mitochondrial isoform X2 [Culicoides brevitarsis]|uniref:tryptophan--tRNA ligase, mitochondrial isoform X2 n=1 Tax=Culicoides brevitarsis TaxID=469753 RepID=UPI00307CB458
MITRKILKNLSIKSKTGQLWYSTKLSKKKEPEFPKKIFSGVQPTGALHIGNYFGAIKRWVDLQNSGENVTYSVVDLHSITLPQDPKVLRDNTMKLTATLLACGIDPKKATLFLQSSVPQHTELSWILGCLTTMTRLTHLPQYKEKSATLKEIPLGLFMYPVLQAADIMLASHVPVGEDQVQHLQLAMHLAKIFNNKYGFTFPQCQPIIADDPSARLKSLRDPTKKMSKSDSDPKSCIYLTDSPKEILNKIKKAVTDCTSEVAFDPINRSGVANLITIHSLASNLSPEEICESAKEIDTGKYKPKVAEALIEHLNPIREKIEDYLKHPEYLEQVLSEGGERASNFAEETLSEVKEKIGIANLNLTKSRISLKNVC